MEDLIITLLIIGTGYYLLTKSNNNSQATQTDNNLKEDEKESYQTEIDVLTRKNKELEAEITANNQTYQTQLKQKDNEVRRVQNEVRELAKRPLKPTNSKGTQTDPETELTNTLDTLIKSIQELNNSLC